MKYSLKAIGYLLLWLFLLNYIILERFVKYIVLISKIIWHFKVKKEWYKPLRTYYVLVLVPFPLVVFIPLIWRVNTLKDLFLCRNWDASEMLLYARKLFRL